jgi:hypothetical protein
MGGAGPGVRRPDPRRARVESFSPDGATLATSADVTLLWDLDPDTWRGPGAIDEDRHSLRVTARF